MARTSLLNRLQQWARELRALEPADRSDKETGGRPLTRREFLAGTGAAGMLAVLPKWAKAVAVPKPFFQCLLRLLPGRPIYRLRGGESVPQGGVLFCGEHTFQDFQGYREGGARQGERAAKALLNIL
jgi:hypothetical protein